MTIKDRLDNIKRLRDDTESEINKLNLRTDTKQYAELAGKSEAYTTALKEMVAMLKELRQSLDMVTDVSPSILLGLNSPQRQGVNDHSKMVRGDVMSHIPPATELDAYTEEA